MFTPLATAYSRYEKARLSPGSCRGRELIVAVVADPFERARRERAPELEKVAALTILQSSELSLQQHLDLAPDLLNYSRIVSEGESEPLMMAQPVPHQTANKKARQSL